MVRGNYRGRGAFGGAGNHRGGSGSRGGGYGGGPLLTNHLRDLDIELQLLQRKRQIFEQEQNILDRFANSASNFLSANSNQYSSGSHDYSTNSNNYSNNSNKKQYDNNQPFHNYSQQSTGNQFNFANHSAAYQPGPGSSNFKPQGVKRQAYPVWQNQDSSPPKRLNTPQSINPWQNPTTRQAEFRAVNQNPPQPKNFSAQSRSLMTQKPGIGQRITSKYNPPPQRKNFKPNKVTKPDQRLAAKAPVYRPSIETKKLIDETNKLIAHTNKIVGQIPKSQGQNPPPKGHYPPPKGRQNPPTKVLFSPKKINTPPKSQNPAQNTIPKHMKKKFEQDNVLHPDRQPSGQIKGRLELALGMILKSVKELCPDAGTLEYFNIPFIQRVIKHTLRVRIRDVMMNEHIDNVRNIVDKYREKYPQTTDIELMKIAQDAHSYNNNQWRVLQLVEADDPEEFFKKNIGKILHNKLNEVFTDIYKGLDIVTAKASRQERELVPHHLLDILEPHQVFTVVDFRARALKIVDNLTKQGKIPIIVGGTNYYIESIVYQILVEHTDDAEELLWDKSKRKRDSDETDPISEGVNKRLANECEDSKCSKDISDVLPPESNVKDYDSKDSAHSTSESVIKNNITTPKEEEKRIIDAVTLKEDVDNERKFTNEEIHSKLKAIDPVMASRLHPNNRRKVLR